MDHRKETQMKIQLVLTMVLFGTIGLFVRNIQLPSSVIAMTRGLVGALCLALFLKLRGRSPAWGAIRRNGLLLVLSGAAMGINWILLFEAYRHTTVATATLAYYLAPVIVILVSALTGRESLTLFKGFCVLLALSGMVMVSGVLGGTSPGSASFTGLLFGTGAAVLYATVVLINRELQAIPAFDSTMIQLAMAGIVLLPYVLLTEDLARLSPDSRSLLLLAVVAIIYTGFAYVLYFATMQVLKAQTIAIYSYLDPLTAVLVSGLILREPISAFTILGGALILGSTFLSEWTERRATLKNRET